MMDHILKGGDLAPLLQLSLLNTDGPELASTN